MTGLMEKLRVFFKSNKDSIGSKERLEKLLWKFNQSSSPLFLIAGSWGIELTSGKVLEHDDIDLIVLQNPPYYIDDAEEIEESCFDIIPLDSNYFEDNFLEREFKGIKVFVPSYNLQICLKLIGQLQENLPERAIKQLEVLLGSYEGFDKGKSQEEINYILGKLTPEDLNYKAISEYLVGAIENYLKGEKGKSIDEFIKIHSLINKSLRFQFEKRGLTKKIGISLK